MPKQNTTSGPFGASGEGQIDLSASKGFTLTYSATHDLWVQMRPAFQWNGGAQYLTKVPSTGGQIMTRFFPFTRASWTSLVVLGTPTFPFDMLLGAVRGLVFVGDVPNTLVFTGLRFDAYVPVCRPHPRI